MKHRYYFGSLAIAATIVLAAVLGFTACSSEDYKEDPAFDEEIKTELVAKSELPQWLADYATYLEYVPEGIELPRETAGIYRFEWNGKTYYEISSASQSSMHQDLYDASGNRIKLGEEDYLSLSEGTRNWTIVYLFHYTHEHPAVYPVKIVDPELQLFFQNLFSDGKMNNGIKFGSKAHKKNTCYVINSPAYLKSLYEGIDSLPAFDFNQYSLIIGVVHVPRGSYLKRQELTSGDDFPTLHLYYEKPLSATEEIGEPNATSYFYALYPKLPSEWVYVSLNDNYQEVYLERSDSFSFAIFSPFSSDWESSLMELESISTEDFSKTVKGYGWQEESLHILNDDGSYDLNSVWGVGGISVHCYEFSKYVVTDYWRNSNPSQGSDISQWYYIDLNNMVYMGPQATLQIISVEGDRMVAVKRIHIPSTKVGDVRDISYIVVLRRLSDKELQEVKSLYPNNYISW